MREGGGRAATGCPLFYGKVIFHPFGGLQNFPLFRPLSFALSRNHFSNWMRSASACAFIFSKVTRGLWGSLSGDSSIARISENLRKDAVSQHPLA